MTLTNAQPSSLAGDLRGEPVHVVVAALDGDQRAAVHRGGDHLRAFQVVRDEHDGRDPGAGPGRGHGVGEVAGGGTGEDPHAQLAGRRQRDRDDAVLEGVGRVSRVVLDPQSAQAQLAAQVVRPDQPGEPGLQIAAGADVGGDREQVAVAPHVGRPRLDPGAGHRGEVVADLQRAEALGARVGGAERLGGATLTADQRGGVAERARAGRDGDGQDRRAHGRPPSHLPRRPALGAGRSWHRWPGRTTQVVVGVNSRVAGASAGRVPLPLSMRLPA